MKKKPEFISIHDPDCAIFDRGYYNRDLKCDCRLSKKPDRSCNCHNHHYGCACYEKESPNRFKRCDCHLSSGSISQVNISCPTHGLERKADPIGTHDPSCACIDVVATLRGPCNCGGVNKKYVDKTGSDISKEPEGIAGIDFHKFDCDIYNGAFPPYSCSCQDSAKLNKKYIDKTGSDQKPNPLRDVFQEFPLAMMEIARVTAFGVEKHASRGWQTFSSVYGIKYHTGKLGRHLLAEETEGMVNEADGGLFHAAQVAWNALARLEHILRAGKTSKT